MLVERFYRLKVCEFIHEIEPKNTTFCNKVVISTLTSYSFFSLFQELFVQFLAIILSSSCRNFQNNKSVQPFLWYDNT
ncbi:hypothetical protein JS44_10195 [Anoxybacillus flavithermus]|uniref:Uncharacterized protein n=1 Tax=Anoxybacillus flavithermus TaxID=33934 RepID=A0A094IXF6_9BACL|nr:hypothetical protein JS44_10195 [Anoxybacillus flavithermus]